MVIVDVVILFFIALGAFIGFKQGAVKRLTSFVGTIIILIVAFTFKSELSAIMYESLPFFSFGGVIKGVEVLNILLYEILAFVLLFTLLSFLLRVLIVISGLVEMILKMTIFLSIPSKILGLFVGAIEYYIYAFVVIVFISLPVFNLNILESSNLASTILNKTPLLSSLASNTVDTYTKVYDIMHDSKEKSNEQLNREIIVILIDNKIITKESAIRLSERKKIHLPEGFDLNAYNAY